MKLFEGNRLLRQERRIEYRYKHTCGECGIRSRWVLKAGHPVKDCYICEACRLKLWYPTPSIKKHP